jgi:hypothetical protein
MTFPIPRQNHRGSTGLPDQELYDKIAICRWCETPSKTDKCPKCGRKVTNDPVEPRRERELTDLMTKVRYEFSGISVKNALEILSNGDCGD